jgi:glucose/arabinose dehydrogenase
MDHRGITLLAGLLLALAAAACGGPTPLGPTPPIVTPSPPAGRSPTPAPPASSSPGAGASATPATSIGLELVADGLADPLFAGHAGDGSGRLFVLEQAGRIRVVRDGSLLPEPYLDLSDRIAAGGERGLLGLAFSPAFGTDGRLFVDYTDRDGNTVVSEVTAPDPAADRADPASERVLLRIEQPYANHNGGALAMGADGLLWIATGDGGSGGDPQGNGQRLDTLLGKLLRIDPRPAAGAPYAMPADNPFVGRAGGRKEARGEIWAYGLRNPWRFSFDRATGDLWIGDVGQGSLEEVDHWPAGSPAGPNFGWNTMEGSACFEPADGCDRDGLVLPVAEYGHDRGCAVTGGYVYRGAGVAGLTGTYLYADYCSGTIWGLDAAAERPEPRALLESGVSVASFGEDEAGEVYVVDLAGGRVYRVIASAGQEARARRGVRQARATMTSTVTRISLSPASTGVGAASVAISFASRAPGKGPGCATDPSRIDRTGPSEAPAAFARAPAFARASATAASRAAASAAARSSTSKRTPSRVVAPAAIAPSIASGSRARSRSRATTPFRSS